MFSKKRQVYLLLGITFALLSIFLPTLIQAKDLPEGLVLYLKFDNPGEQEINDHSGSGNIGAINGNPELVEGPEGLGNALRFKSNSDYIEVADSESIKPEHITIAVWIKSELTAGSIETIRKFEWPTKGYLIKVEPDFNYTYLFLFDGQSSKGVTVPLVEEDKWEHVAVSFDGEQQIGYYNGEIGVQNGEAILKWEGALAHTNNPLTIGGITGFRGAIDEIAIYNRALTQEEIQKSMGLGHVQSVEPISKLATIWGNLKVIPIRRQR